MAGTTARNQGAYDGFQGGTLGMRVRQALTGTGATLAARAVLGLVFAVSAVTKLQAPGLFTAEVEAYHLLPVGLVPPFALALPWLEAMVALYLLAGLLLRPAAVLTAAMLLMFAGAMTANLMTGNVNHSCGCLSAPDWPVLTWVFGGSTITLFDIARDAVFLGLTAIVYWGNRSVFSLETRLFGASAAVAPDMVEE